MLTGFGEDKMLIEYSIPTTSSEAVQANLQGKRTCRTISIRSFASVAILAQDQNTIIINVWKCFLANYKLTLKLVLIFKAQLYTFHLYRDCIQSKRSDH